MMLLNIDLQSSFFFLLSILINQVNMQLTEPCPPFIHSAPNSSNICSLIMGVNNTDSTRTQTCWHCSIKNNTANATICEKLPVECIILSFSDTKYLKKFFQKYNVFVNNLFVNNNTNKSELSVLNIITQHYNLTMVNLQYLRSILGNQTKYYKNLNLNLGRSLRPNQHLRIHNDSLSMNFKSIHTQILCDDNRTIDYMLMPNETVRDQFSSCDLQYSTQVTTTSRKTQISQQSKTKSSISTTKRLNVTTTKSPKVKTQQRTTKSSKAQHTTKSAKKTITTTPRSTITTTTTQLTTSTTTATAKTTTTVSETSTTHLIPTDSKPTIATSMKAVTEIVSKDITRPPSTYLASSTVAITSTPIITSTKPMATTKLATTVISATTMPISSETTLEISTVQPPAVSETRITRETTFETTNKTKPSTIIISTKSSSPPPPTTIITTTTTTSRKSKTSFLLLLFCLFLIAICLILGSLYLYLIYRRHKQRDEFNSDSATQSVMTTIDSSNIPQSTSKPAATVSETFISSTVQLPNEFASSHQSIHRPIHGFDDDF